MKSPSKVTSFKESSLSKLPILLDLLNQHDRSPCALYDETKKHFESIEEFVDTLVLLYALGKISFDIEGGRINIIFSSLNYLHT